MNDIVTQCSRPSLRLQQEGEEGFSLLDKGGATLDLLLKNED